MAAVYVIEPDGTIAYEPTPEDWERIMETERELQDAFEHGT